MSAPLDETSRWITRRRRAGTPLPPKAACGALGKGLKKARSASEPCVTGG